MSAETSPADSYARRLMTAARRGFVFGAIASVVASLAAVSVFGPFALLGVLFVWPIGGITAAALFAGAAALSSSPKINAGPWGEPPPEQSPPKTDVTRSELLRRLARSDDSSGN